MDQHHSDIFTTADGKSRLLRGVAIYSGSTRLAEMAMRMGFDTAWIEMEHGPADFGLAESLCQAIEAGGGVPTIRVSDGQRCHILRALEVGGRIIVVPMINNADQAEQIVRHGKFPPVGARGYNTRSRGVGYGLDGCTTAFAEANARTFVFAQIETLEAVDNLNAICAVQGLSGIFIGPGDLSASVGCPGNFTDAGLIGMVSDCIRRARKADKHAGVLVTPGPLLDAALEAGCDLCFCGGDYTNICQPWRELLDTVHSPKEDDAS